MGKKAMSVIFCFCAQFYKKRPFILFFVRYTRQVEPNYFRLPQFNKQYNYYHTIFRENKEMSQKYSKSKSQMSQLRPKFMNTMAFNKRSKIEKYLREKEAEMFGSLYQIKCLRALSLFQQKNDKFKYHSKDQFKFKKQLINKIANSIKLNIKQFQKEKIIKIRRLEPLIASLQFYSGDTDAYFQNLHEYDKIKCSVIESFRQLISKGFWVVEKVGKNKQPGPNQQVQVGFEFKKQIYNNPKQQFCFQNGQGEEKSLKSSNSETKIKKIVKDTKQLQLVFSKKDLQKIVELTQSDFMKVISQALKNIISFKILNSEENDKEMDQSEILHSFQQAKDTFKKISQPMEKKTDENITAPTVVMFLIIDNWCYEEKFIQDFSIFKQIVGLWLERLNGILEPWFGNDFAIKQIQGKYIQVLKRMAKNKQDYERIEAKKRQDQERMEADIKRLEAKKRQDYKRMEAVLAKMQQQMQQMQILIKSSRLGQ